MEVFERILEQVQAVGLPMFAVSMTAVPCANTPVLLVLHWHGFGEDRDAQEQAQRRGLPKTPVPDCALQMSTPWNDLSHLDDAMLSAAWQFGAWDLVREERRGCNTAGAPEREALECRQAFADNPFDPGNQEHLIAEAPDRDDLMHLGARVGYVRWQFRPVRNGLWRDTAHDDSLLADGGRTPPCPVRARPTIGTRLCRTQYRLGRNDHIILT